jgi:cytochrome b involved in lipid metabolism
MLQIALTTDCRIRSQKKMLTCHRVADNSKKGFKWEEVAEHNTPDSLWIAVRGKVYDVTNFAQKHPGGSDIVRFTSLKADLLRLVLLLDVMPHKYSRRIMI